MSAVPLMQWHGWVSADVQEHAACALTAPLSAHHVLRGTRAPGRAEGSKPRHALRLQQPQRLLLGVKDRLCTTFPAWHSNLAQKVTAPSLTASATLYRRPAGMLRTAGAGAEYGRMAGRA